MKTVDDVLRSMREFADEQEKNGYYDLRVLSTDSFRACADLIEKAVKNHFRDTTKMMPHLRDVTKKGKVVVAKMETTTPRRNCDVYTMAEQSKRHEEYCKSHSTNGRCAQCPLWQMRLLGINCAIAWANFPYEKEGEK